MGRKVKFLHGPATVTVRVHGMQSLIMDFEDRVIMPERIPPYRFSISFPVQKEGKS